MAGCTTEQPDTTNQTVQKQVVEDKTFSCSDNKTNGNETDIDCGGDCTPCKIGRGCLLDSDCTTGLCLNETCARPSCSDGIKNQDETGIDCGGPCPPCEKETQEINYSLAPEARQKLDEKLTIGRKSDFLYNAYPTGIDVGGSYVFAYGITNTYLQQKNTTFRFHIEFKRARDNRDNPISVDEETVLGWFSENNFAEPALGKYEQALIPVGVTVGDEIADGAPTEPGSYYFTMVVEYKTGNSFEEYVKDDFSFKVS